MEELPDEDAGDSREERAFRMWINSLGIEGCPHVNNLFDDVSDALVLLHTEDHVYRVRNGVGVVEWDTRRVNRDCRNMVFKKVENANYAIEIGLKRFFFSLVGVQGKDIVDGNKKLTLALCWQLMRYHLLAFLAGVRTARGGASPRGDGGAKEMSDKEMVEWANAKVAEAGSVSGARMSDFHDKSLASGLFLIDLLAAVEPRCIDRQYVTAGSTEEERKLNAKCADPSLAHARMQAGAPSLRGPATQPAPAPNPTRDLGRPRTPSLTRTPPPSPSRRYVISSARKLNCSLFLLWEDIVDVRPKMILSFIATVMSVALRG